MPYSSKRAIELLKLGTRDTKAIFRPGQEEAIRHMVEGRGRLLVVQKTGWGKSFVYFIAAKMLQNVTGSRKRARIVGLSFTVVNAKSDYGG